MVGITRLGAAAIGGGAVGAASYTAANAKTRKGEHFANNMGTAATLGLIGATPYVVSKAVKANKRSTVRIAQKTGEHITKVVKYIANKAPIVAKKIKATKLGKKTFEIAEKWGNKLVDYITKNPKLRNRTIKTLLLTADAGNNIAKSSYYKRGKAGLIVGGAVLLAGAAIHALRDHDKKSGAIDQKYKDMKVFSEII